MVPTQLIYTSDFFNCCLPLPWTQLTTIQLVSQLIWSPPQLLLNCVVTGPLLQCSRGLSRVSIYWKTVGPLAASAATFGLFQWLVDSRLCRDFLDVLYLGSAIWRALHFSQRFRENSTPHTSGVHTFLRLRGGGGFVFQRDAGGVRLQLVTSKFMYWQSSDYFGTSSPANC
jgi:hypothetical protein